jgi:hypothetical protein
MNAATFFHFVNRILYKSQSHIIQTNNFLFLNLNILIPLIIQAHERHGNTNKRDILQL